MAIQSDQRGDRVRTNEQLAGSRFAEMKSISLDEPKHLACAQASEHHRLIYRQTLDLLAALTAPFPPATDWLLPNHEGLNFFRGDDNLPITPAVESVPLQKGLAFHARDFYPHPSLKVL